MFLRRGLISLALIDCRTSVMVCRCASYPPRQQPSAMPPLQLQICHTFAASVPWYTGISRQPLSAPSASPPRSSCLTWPASCRTSGSLISGCGVRRVEVSKLTLESSVRASMLMVRQASLSEALVCCWMMDIAAASVC